MTYNIAIIHYNTPALTLALVRSIRKHMQSCRIVVFDNSDRLRFPPQRDVEWIDNTRGQVVDFEAMIAEHPYRLPSINRYASAKHIASVEWLLGWFDEGFLLLDSDVLLKKDASPLFDKGHPWTGMMDTPHNSQRWHRPRMAPYCLYINAPKCRRHGIHFMSEGRIDVLSCDEKPYYDTGASFYEDCRKAGLTGREVDIYEYIEHFGGASYLDKKQEAKEWLDKHKNLYE